VPTVCYVCKNLTFSETEVLETIVIPKIWTVIFKSITYLKLKSLIDDLSLKWVSLLTRFNLNYYILY
jgi:hypothetical protein